MSEPKLGIYLVERREGGGDYWAFIACCENEDRARRLHPVCNYPYNEELQYWVSSEPKFHDQAGKDYFHDYGWVLGKDISLLKVTRLGTAEPSSIEGVIMSTETPGLEEVFI
jgi:hypothetical protein